jgi:hypothetical protein
MSDPSPPTPQQLVEALTDGISQLDNPTQIGAKTWMSVGKDHCWLILHKEYANSLVLQQISHSPKVARLWLKKPWNGLSRSQTWTTKERDTVSIISLERNRWDWSVYWFLMKAPCTYSLIFFCYRPFKCVSVSWRSLELKMAL